MDLQKEISAQLDHVAINSENFEATLRFFEEVFHMVITRQTGVRPFRKAWFQQGIQVCETASASRENTLYDHIAIRVNDKAVILEKAKAYGCTMIEGKNGWLTTPDGVMIELMP